MKLIKGSYHVKFDYLHFVYKHRLKLIKRESSVVYRKYDIIMKILYIKLYKLHNELS